MYFNIDGSLIKRSEVHVNKSENVKTNTNNMAESNHKNNVVNVTENNNSIEPLDYNGILRFLKSSVSEDITVEDLKIYRDDLEMLTLEVDNKSNLLETANYKSLFGIMAYAYKNDIELDKWFIEYFKKENTYETDQTRNSLITFTKNVNVA